MRFRARDKPMIPKHSLRKLPDYHHLKPSFTSTALWTCSSAVGLFLVGWVFYQHIVWASLLCLCSCWVPRIVKRSYVASIRNELLYQFQQALQVLSAALAAGRSLENALIDSTSDLEQMFASPDAMIVKEWRGIIERLRNGIRLEVAIEDLARRSGIEDIQNFAEVLVIGKRQGGNIVEVIRNTVQILSDKLDIQRDIRVLIARKRWECRILCAAPIGFVTILGLTSQDYMEPLYADVGRVVMTIALMLIGCGWWLSQRIMKIEV